jgi:hypothetical protein
LVVSHYPPYSDGKFDSDITMTTMRVNFMPLLDAAGMDFGFGGHGHAYERMGLIAGHYGDSSTFDADTMGLNLTKGGCCESQPYTKVKGDPGAFHVVAGHACTLNAQGCYNYPAQVQTFNTRTTPATPTCNNLSFGGEHERSPPGTGQQGTSLVTIQDTQLDFHMVHWSGRAWDHAQLRHVE